MTVQYTGHPLTVNKINNYLSICKQLGVKPLHTETLIFVNLERYF